MSTPVEHAWGYLTPPEVRFLDAAVDRLIPPDDLGPGGKEARVTVFIDRQMCTGYGVAARWYRMGPWLQGTAQQGWQCPLTPQEVYRQGIREIDAWCVKQHERPFWQLKPEQQDAILKDLSKDKVELHSVSAKLFFDLLLKNTKEGFFSDPVHGGNRGNVGWKLLGFPGVASGEYKKYMTPENDNVPYEVEPVSLLDIQEGRAQLNGQGFPKHIPLKKV